MSILNQIAEETRYRVAAQKRVCPSFEYVKGRPGQFKDALRGDDIRFICEVKKASPSKGIIAEAFPYLEIARSYEAAGANAISVLTEPKHFKGAPAYLEAIAKQVKIPVLRKDFVVDPYMLYEARHIGAQAVLLICALLTPNALAQMLEITEKLGMDALVEAHTADEVNMAVQAGAKIIGVNNRNLKTFEVDFNTSLRLRTLVPAEIVFVAESGIRTQADVATLKNAGVDAVLIGESLMRAPDKKEMLSYLKGAIK